MEVGKSLNRGNGLLGIYIHMLKDKDKKADVKGEKPAMLPSYLARCYSWNPKRFGVWVEKAAVKVGHPCLKHGDKQCPRCG